VTHRKVEFYITISRLISSLEDDEGFSVLKSNERRERSGVLVQLKSLRYNEDRASVTSDVGEYSVPSR